MNWFLLFVSCLYSIFLQPCPDVYWFPFMSVNFTTDLVEVRMFSLVSSLMIFAPLAACFHPFFLTYISSLLIYPPYLSILLTYLSSLLIYPPYLSILLTYLSSLLIYPPYLSILLTYLSSLLIYPPYLSIHLTYLSSLLIDPPYLSFLLVTYFSSSLSPFLTHS